MNPSSQPSSSPTKSQIKPYVDDNPLYSFILVCLAVSCSIAVICVMFNRFFVKRRIMQMINRNAVGRFLIELRAEQEFNIPPNAQAEHRPNYNMLSQQPPEEVSSFIIRKSRNFSDFISDRFASKKSPLGCPTVVETTAVPCVYDASEFIVSCESVDDGNGTNFHDGENTYFNVFATEQEILGVEGRDSFSPLIPPPITHLSADRLHENMNPLSMDRLFDNTNARYNTQYI